MKRAARVAQLESASSESSSNHKRSTLQAGRKCDAVFTDFDGTVVTEDLALLALRRFASPGWEEFDRLSVSGALSLEQALSAQYAMIRAGSASEIVSYLRRHYQLREGFPELSETCRENGIPLVVLSAGLDFCIWDALSRLGARVDKVVCPKSMFSPNGIAVRFPHFSPRFRNFKEAAVEEYRRNGLRFVYAGDGPSDLYPAMKAEVAFAVAGSALEKQLSKNGTRFASFESFSTVSRLVR